MLFRLMSLFQRCRNAFNKKNAVFRMSAINANTQGCASSDEQVLTGEQTRADDPLPMRMPSPELAHLRAAELRRSRRGRR